jgi:hypothetical protein
VKFKLTLVCWLVMSASALRSEDLPAIKVRFFFEDHPPFTYSEGDAVKGIFAEAAEKALATSDTEILWQKGTYNRIKRQLSEQRSAFCVAGHAKGGSLEDNLWYSRAFARFGKSGLLVRTADKARFEEIATVEDLFLKTNLIGGFVSGAVYAVPYQRYLPNSPAQHLLASSSHEQLAQLVAKGRIDFVFENEMMVKLHQATVEGGSSLDFVWLPGMPEGRDAYIVCTKKVNEATLARIDSGIEAIKKAAQ